MLLLRKIFVFILSMFRHTECCQLLPTLKVYLFDTLVQFKYMCYLYRKVYCYSSEVMSNAVSCLTQQFGRLIFNIGLQEHAQLQPPDGSFCVA